jgi:hypothetical protein
VVFILVDVIFFSVVFVYLNSATLHAVDNIQKAKPFISCLVANPTSHEKCTSFGEALFVDLHTVAAVLIMLSVSPSVIPPFHLLTSPQLAGIQVFLLLVRSSMFIGWWDFFYSKFGSKREFVSLDAKQPPEYTPDTRQIELTKFSHMPATSPHTTVASPGTEYDFEANRRSLTGTPDYFSKETQRSYTSPTLSFSTPRAPTQAAVRGEWDPRSTHARGGLGLHPPLFEEDDDVKERKV